jgi:hypothetical protein
MGSILSRKEPSDKAGTVLPAIGRRKITDATPKVMTGFLMI